MLELKSSKGTGYKALARQTKVKICSPESIVCNYVAVDVRSRLFKYVREISMIRNTKRKVRCVFGLLLQGINSEIKRVCNEALERMMAEVHIIGADKVKYVFCSPNRCPYRERLRLSDRILEKTKAKERLAKALSKCKKHILKVSVMIECHSAFVGYVIAHIEEVCLIYNNIISEKNISGRYWAFSTVMPYHEDSYESDRLCARISENLYGKFSSDNFVLSEDYDCTFLFGAKKMIRKVTKHAVQYVTIKDAMKVFGCNNRQSLVYKCCLMGTDYNLGLKGIGPKKAVATNNERVLAKECMKQQCINIRELMEFFLVKISSVRR